ncbi:MAG: DUF4199 domain-containing protein [Bacteroidota bacterium]|jgi:hypothetical protein|nr:DUF4199 domain-containing protein [Bacteroidota bacterium]
MEQTIGKPGLLNQVLKYGIIIAMVNIIITLLIYVVDVTIMVKWWFGILILLVNLVLIFYAGFDWRKQNGGYLKFKDAFIFIFLVFVCSGIISVLFNIFLNTVIDPNLANTLTEASIEENTAIMERFGLADDQVDEAMENLRAGLSEQFSVTGILKGFLYSLIFYVIAALIVGAIIKKSRPEFEG